MKKSNFIFTSNKLIFFTGGAMSSGGDILGGIASVMSGATDVLVDGIGAAASGDLIPESGNNPDGLDEGDDAVSEGSIAGFVFDIDYYKTLTIRGDDDRESPFISSIMHYETKILESRTKSLSVIESLRENSNLGDQKLDGFKEAVRSKFLDRGHNMPSDEITRKMNEFELVLSYMKTRIRLDSRVSGELGSFDESFMTQAATTGSNLLASYQDMDPTKRNIAVGGIAAATLGILFLLRNKFGRIAKWGAVGVVLATVGYAGSELFTGRPLSENAARLLRRSNQKMAEFFGLNLDNAVDRDKNIAVSMLLGSNHQDLFSADYNMGKFYDDYQADRIEEEAPIRIDTFYSRNEGKLDLAARTLFDKFDAYPPESEAGMYWQRVKDHEIDGNIKDVAIDIMMLDPEGVEVFLRNPSYNPDELALPTISTVTGLPTTGRLTSEMLDSSIVDVQASNRTRAAENLDDANVTIREDLSVPEGISLYLDEGTIVSVLDMSHVLSHTSSLLSAEVITPEGESLGLMSAIDREGSSAVLSRGIYIQGPFTVPSGIEFEGRYDIIVSSDHPNEGSSTEDSPEQAASVSSNAPTENPDNQPAEGSPSDTTTQTPEAVIPPRVQILVNGLPPEQQAEVLAQFGELPETVQTTILGQIDNNMTQEQFLALLAAQQVLQNRS